MLTNIAKVVEFNAAKIKDCKTQLQSTVRKVSALKKDNAELMERVLELERYKCRWNLRICGLKEKVGEDIREVVVQLLVKISPSWSSNINHIVDHAICKELCISFSEDLCKTDRETRAALWLEIMKLEMQENVHTSEEVLDT